MGKYTTIKVSKNTLKRLHELAGKLTQKKGKRVTLEEAIVQILNEHKRRERESGLDNLGVKRERETLLSLLETKVEGAGPEDFLEYNFEDMGGKSESE